MKLNLPSINFNEGGRFLTFAFNYMNLWFFMALAIPYPWYGKSISINYLIDPKICWHLKYKVLTFVVYKSSPNPKREVDEI